MSHRTSHSGTRKSPAPRLSVKPTAVPERIAPAIRPEQIAFAPRPLWFRPELIASSLVVLLVGVWFLYRGFPSSTVTSTQAAKPPAREVTLYTVGRTLAPRWLEVTGTVRPELESTISAKIVGRVTAVLVRQGDTVRSGQPLVQLDSRELDAAVSQAGANLTAAHVGKDTAGISATMQEGVSRANLAEARAAVTERQAAVRAASAKLDLVRAGPRKQEREQATLAVTQAQSAYSLAKNNLERMRSLADEGAISQQHLDSIKTECDVAKARYESAVQARNLVEEGSRAEEIRAAEEQLRQAQAGLDQSKAAVRQAEAGLLETSVKRQEIRAAEARIGQSKAALQISDVTRSYSSIAAPFDGIVTARLADPGTLAAPGLPLLKIQGGMQRLEAVVPEGAIRGIRVGESIAVRLDAGNGASIAGRVCEISPSGDAASHTFIVKIEVPRQGVSSGMFGRARFRTGSESRILIPASAVWEREGIHYVYAVDSSGRARLRIVTSGASEGERIEVLSGLEDGAQIVTGGREGITDGARVQGR